ncbi:MAG TPA: hypothetical protein VLA36_14240 [Longimicrobiales bacterium]|nr:hypothetical protein [Longimicrobiales bacterium]
MKIDSVTVNGRRRCFEIGLARRSPLDFPFARAEPAPCPDDPVVDAWVDPELAREGVAYRLESGAEGVILADQVLDYHKDPDYLRDLILHQLTVEAIRRMDASALGVREIGRRLRTSPAQIYRLLDPTNYRKSVDRMLALLQVLDARVELRVY